MITLGAIKSPFSPKDWQYSSVATLTRATIPEEGGIDEFPFIIQDQLDMPICTGESGSYLQQRNQTIETGKTMQMSALALYKMNRLIDGLDPSQGGSTNKATVENLRLLGICQEMLFPSNRTLYDMPVTPYNNESIKADAYNNRILAYTVCRNFDEMLIALAEKKPVIFALFLTKDFWLKAQNGFAPREISGDIAGGHSMLAIKYNTKERWVKVVQSWGNQSFTDRGYMYIPFEWFEYVMIDWGGFPFLMDAYACLDYVPQPQIILPKTLTVGSIIPKIMLNGIEVKDERVITFIAAELSKTFVSIRTLEAIGERMQTVIGRPIQISFDQATYEVRISI